MKIWEILNAIFVGDPEFPNLEKYVEIEIERRVDPRRDVALAFAFSVAALGGLAAVGSFFLLGSATLAILAGVTGVVAGPAFVARYHSRLTEDERALTQARREARGFLFELQRWKRRRLLKRKLGVGIGEVLDAGALYWLRLQAALSVDSWGEESSDSSRSLLRSRALNAMDAAMAKLLIVANESQGSDIFSSPGFDSARQLAEEMRELAKGAEGLADRQRIEGVAARGPADELRETLAEMQRLEAAEQEVLRINRNP